MPWYNCFIPVTDLVTLLQFGWILLQCNYKAVIHPLTICQTSKTYNRWQGTTQPGELWPMQSFRQKRKNSLTNIQVAHVWIFTPDRSNWRITVYTNTLFFYPTKQAWSTFGIVLVLFMWIWILGYVMFDHIRIGTVSSQGVDLMGWNLVWRLEVEFLWYSTSFDVSVPMSVWLLACVIWQHGLECCYNVEM